MQLYDLIAEAGAGFLIVAILWYLARGAEISDKRSIRISTQIESLNKTSLKTDITTGYSDGSGLRNRAFDTIYSARANYVNLGSDGAGSISGGTNFSYSFWALLRDPNKIDRGGMTILLKGDQRQYTWWSRVALQHASSANTGRVSTTDIMIKAPQISLVGNSNGTCDIVFSTNTTESIDASMVITGTPSQDPTLRYNVMSLIIGNWSLWTFSVTDYTDDDGNHGCQMSFYINDLLVKQQVLLRQTVRANLGDLILFPALINANNAYKYPTDDSLRAMYIGDLQFSSPALSFPDIQARVVTGVTNQVATVSTSSTNVDINNKLVLSSANIVNYSNT